ncbi:MAG: peptidase, partial [Planctomycetota bacterium]
MTGPYTGGFPTDDIAATVGDSVLKLQLYGQGSSFDAATLLDTAAAAVGNGNLVLPSNQHLQITADITAAKEDRSAIPYPGMSDEPGQRDLPAEANNGGAQRINPAFGPDLNSGLETIPYNFKSLYGFDPQGKPLQNVINDTQKERIREALELWSNYIGVQFYETDDQGLTFATGDLRSLNTTAPMIRTVPSGLVRVDPSYTDSLLVLDTNNTWNNAFGQSYFTSAMTAVGYLLGVGSSPELPTSGEPVYPSPSDVATGLLLHRAESNDIDMYKFTVDFSVGTSDATTGVFTAETFAERLSESSQLNTVLRLYKEVPAVNSASSTDFNSNGAVQVTFTAQESGNRGNSYQLSFSGGGASSTPQIIVVGRTINVVMNNNTTAQEVVDALNFNTDSAALVQARITRGNAATKVGTFAINYSPVSLVGGADVRREVIAQNDNYYSQDSLLSVNLTSGTYYLGVSSVGNTDYDPTIEDSGYGGRTAGKYQLKVDFRPQVAASDSIRDLDYRTEGRMGTPLDGDGDGKPGGVYDFWFQTRNDNRVLEVIGDSGSFSDGQLITITNFLGVVRRFEINTTGGVGSGNVAVNLLPGESAATVAGKLAAAINGSLGFNSSVVTVGGVGNNLLTFTGDRLVTLSTDIIGLKLNGKTIFVNKAAGPNADGSKDRPFNNVSSTTVPSAFSAAQPGDIVRIVGNGGSDGKMETLADNFAYEVGFGSLPGQTLSDGTTMEVPKGVTVMIDAGAIFKLRAARIGVGSSSLGVDRSGAALQVLGTPQQSVYFTSWLDETIGLDTFLPATTPGKGNWGGIAFKNDLDRVKGQATDYESQGIFLNYVNNADIRYGGGIVNVDSIGQVVQPIQMSESRPTLTFNKITQSADSAMSADPASFTETYFNTPQYQLSGQFTPEYNRVGPMIHGNLLLDNSINGLFVRITTTSGTSTKTLTGQGRFDDTDIVHYIPENLEVEGTPGGPILDRTKLPTSLITVTPVSAGRLAAGLYTYRLTLVDANGYEGPASDATNAAALGSIGGVVLRNLPAAPAGYVARRVYRSTDGMNFDLVTQINAADVSYFDNGATLGGALDITRSEVLRPRLNGRLSIDPGTV